MFSNMKICLKNLKGIVLAEALMAIAMLAIASIIMGSILNIAVDATFLSKDYLIANNLLNEEVAVIEGIQNSNRLNKPNTKSCWLTIDPMTPEAECSNPANQAMPGINYRLVKTASSITKLQDSAGNTYLDLENYSPEQDQYKLYLDDTLGFEQYVALELPNSSPNLNQKDSGFYRSVKLLSLVDNEKATFEVKVQWERRKKIRTVSYVFTLTNYF